MPVDLVQRVVIRESRHVPAARNGPYYGLMQILPQTAATMGYRGRPAGLLDAETNLRYGVKYLRGAWLVAGGDRDEAVGLVREGLLLRGQAQGAAGGDRVALSRPDTALVQHSTDRHDRLEYLPRRLVHPENLVVDHDVSVPVPGTAQAEVAARRPRPGPRSRSRAAAAGRSASA